MVVGRRKQNRRIAESQSESELVAVSGCQCQRLHIARIRTAFLHLSPGAGGNQAAWQIWQSEGQEPASEWSKPGRSGPRLQGGSRSSRSWSAGAGELWCWRRCRVAGQAGSTLSASAPEHLSTELKESSCPREVARGLG
ncbi:hypothetical protein NDU88_002510 [Pleurodeles waltl]|uniref:Uncharacterized protein n=1 Tax=Pleurodeles waltl TaxID=8319 RepID=A0AAV7RFY2_PLEWA|nr:hypothetical protein NDU88_002510 [Pleurodeles waltl]